MTSCLLYPSPDYVGVTGVSKEVGHVYVSVGGFEEDVGRLYDEQDRLFRETEGQ